MTDNSIDFDEVKYRYVGSEEWVLKGVNLNIPKQALWLLIGPTGGGKSTILSLARGYQRYFGGELSGTVKVNGIDLNTKTIQDIVRLGVGWVGQDPSTSLHQLTVYEELMSSPLYLNMPWDECKALAEKMLKQFNLSHLRNKSPDILSGGEKQKVAIAAALVITQKISTGVLLLDEPDSFLDHASRKDMLDLLAQLKMKNTIIVATHKMEQYLDIADGTSLVVDGKVVSSGPLKMVMQDEKLGRSMGFPLSVEIKKLKDDSVSWTNDLMGSSESLDNFTVHCSNDFPALQITKPEKENVISFKGVGFEYPEGRLILDDFNLNVPGGSMTAIVGPNGSGKTTIGRLATGLLKPVRGTIKLFGKDTNEFRCKDLSAVVSYVTQIPKTMFLCNTVQEECQLWPKVHDLPDYQLMATKALCQVGLSELKHRTIDELSGGQKRLLSLGATAYVSGSPVLVLDEPEYGIDPKTWARLLAFMNLIRKSFGAVVIMTHLLEGTLFCDKVVVLNKGHIIGQGHPSEIYSDEKLIEEAKLERPSLFPLFAQAWSLNRNISDVKMLMESIKQYSQTNSGT